MMSISKKDLKLVNSMAIPIIATLLLELSFQIINQSIVGRTSVDGFAAVGIVSSFIYVLTGSIGIMGSAYNILAARNISEEKHRYFEKLFNSTISISIILGIIFEILCIIFGRLFFQRFYGLKGNLLINCCDYIYISGVTLGINMLLFVFSAFFKNIRKTRMYFYNTTAASIVDLVLCYVLVFGRFGFPRLGVRGAAVSSVLGLLTSLFVCIIGFLKYGDIRFKFEINKKAFKELIKLYIPLLGQDLIESTVFVLCITSIISRLGAYNIATYNVLVDLTNVMVFPIYAYAGVALTLVAQSNGKGDTIGLRVYPVTSVICTSIFALVFGTVILIFPSTTSNIITNNGNIIGAVSKFVIYAVLIQVFNIVHQVYKYSLQGVSFEKWVLYFSTIISIVILPIIYFLTIYMKLNLVGVYIGMGLNYIILSLGYVFKYRKFKLSV